MPTFPLVLDSTPFYSVVYPEIKRWKANEQSHHNNSVTDDSPTVFFSQGAVL